MSNDNTHGGFEPSPASAGSQPVAWGFAVATEDEQWDEVFYSRECAEDAAGRLNDDDDMGRWKVVRLFPQRTLTDEELDVLATVRDIYASHDDDDACGRIAAVIDGLLERMK